MNTFLVLNKAFNNAIVVVLWLSISSAQLLLKDIGLKRLLTSDAAEIHRLVPSIDIRTLKVNCSESLPSVLEFPYYSL